MSKTYSAGIVTAYGAAKRAGYTGTYEDFCRQQAEYADNAAAVEQAKTDAQAAATNAANSATAAGASATNAAGSATSAGSSATAAAGSATTAGQHKDAAAQSATNAAGSATAAAESATAAARSAQTAQAVLESIPEEYSDLSEDVDKLKADLGDLDDNLGFIKSEVSPNLFDASKMSRGGIVDNGGNRTTTSYYAVSDYIPVTEGDIIRATPFENAATTFALYDSEKVWKSGTRWTQEAVDDYLQIVIPSGIAYVTVNLRGANANSVVITKNTPYSAEYAGNTGTVFHYENAKYKGALLGKTIAYNGDSICETRLISGTAYNGGGYAELIAEQVGCKYENRGLSGGILASAVPTGETMPRRSIVSDVINMTNDADLICFEGGVNDYWKKVPLGSYSESDYTGTLDTTTICGALESIFRQAIAKWVGKPIVFVITHKVKSTVYTQNSAGYTWTDVHEKMIGICRKYAIPYYDAFEESGLNSYNDAQNTEFLTSNATGTPDGCHPNAEGYKRYYVPQLIKLFESVMPN